MFIFSQLNNGLYVHLSALWNLLFIYHSYFFLFPLKRNFIVSLKIFPEEWNRSGVFKWWEWLSTWITCVTIWGKNGKCLNSNSIKLGLWTVVLSISFIPILVIVLSIRRFVHATAKLYIPNISRFSEHLISYHQYYFEL